mgnify:CR=1 FL=1
MADDGPEGPERDARRRFLGNIMLDVERIDRSVSQLLELGRIEAGATVRDPVRVAPLIATLEERFPTVRFEAAVGGERMHVRPADFERAVANLVENALKYRDTAPPRVRITAHRPEGSGICVITVDDNGIGVPPDRREEIFGAFQRLHRRSEYSGVGLGLSMVKQVVQVLCGSITVHDSPLGGARFELRLPTVPQEGV